MNEGMNEDGMNEEMGEENEDPAMGIAVLTKRPQRPGPKPYSKPHRRKQSFVQTEASAVDVKPHSRQHSTDSLAQTKASTANPGWIFSLFSFLQSQAVYWLGARVTLVACAGSLL